jgi:hypothetical protein
VTDFYLARSKAYSMVGDYEKAEADLTAADSIPKFSEMKGR